MQAKDTEYLKAQFNPFLIPLLKELMTQKPENSYEFICNWIETKGEKIQKDLEGQHS